MVRHGRKHCSEHHPQYPLWDLASRQEGVKSTEATEDIEGMVDFSMINAAGTFPSIVLCQLKTSLLKWLHQC
jgi:hypothetical protein